MPRRIHFHFRRNAYRIPFYLLTPIALFLILRFSWGWESAHQLNILKQQLTAKGFNFNPAPPPAGPNPAEALFATASKITLTSADYRLLTSDDPTSPVPIWNAAHKPQVQALLDRLAPTFDEVDADTRSLGTPALGNDPASRGAYKIRSLAGLLCDDSLVLCESRQDFESLHRLAESLAISRIIDAASHSVWTHETARLIRARVANTVEFIQPTLSLDAASLPEAGKLLADLADVGPFNASDVLAYRGEAAFLNEYLDEDYPEIGSWLFRPLHDDALRLSIEALAGFADVASASDWPAAEAHYLSRFHDTRPPTASPMDLNALRSTYVLPASKAGALYRFRAVCDSSAAAILLAAQMYKPLHGHYPQTAKEMVPSLLRFVPIDPFAPGRTPMHYRVDADGPTVWSVGENGTDEHGIVQFDATGKKLRRDLRRYDGDSTYPGQPDIIYGAAWRTAQPPSATTAE